MVDEYNLVNAFYRIEEELIASMIRNLKRHRAEEDKEGLNWSMWQAVQLRELEKYSHANRKKYGGQFRELNRQIEALIRQAKDAGGMEQEMQILRAIKNGFKGMRRGGDALSGEFFRLNEYKLEALIEATAYEMRKVETAILRMADDQYRRIIFSAQVYANTGAGTYEKAVDMATKDFLAAGLNCVEYKNGARHTLSDYADMAIRTASKRAYLAGEGEKRKEYGIATVIVNKRGNPCPKCLPFCGKVLIDDVWSGGSRQDGGYPLMSIAIAHGLYHPRCKDVHTTYFPGMSTADDTWTEEELKAIRQKSKEEAEQQYAKRQEERYERLAKHSLDKENQRIYENRKAIWKKRSVLLTSLEDESLLESLKKRAKETLLRSEIISYDKLPGSLVRGFDNGMKGAEKATALLLQREARQTDFYMSTGLKSEYVKGINVIGIGKNTQPSTLAHELFHKIDMQNSVTQSGSIYNNFLTDYSNIGDIQNLLESRYAYAFEVSMRGHKRLKEEYRGISDIISALSGGKVKLGYGHSVDYWQRYEGIKMEEIWAQCGRIYYENNFETVEMLESLFPAGSEHVKMVIRRLVRNVEGKLGR